MICQGPNPTAMLAELDRTIAAGRVTQKDVARILRCDTGTVRKWVKRLEINRRAANFSPCQPTLLFLIESWAYCRARRITPYAKTKSIAIRLRIREDSFARAAKQLRLEPAILRHPVLHYPIHFWTLAQVKQIAVHTGRLHLLTTSKTIATRSSSLRQASTAKRPRVCRSRHRHTRNFPTHHDDIKS